MGILERLEKRLDDNSEGGGGYRMGVQANYDANQRSCIITVPVVPPKVRHVEKMIFRGSGQYQKYQEIASHWQTILNQAKMLILEKEHNFRSFEYCLVGIRFDEKYAFRDPDNYIINVIHNSLARVNILENDNIENITCNYIVTGRQDVEQTVIFIHEIQQDKLPDTCNKCQIMKTVKGDFDLPDME